MKTALAAIASAIVLTCTPLAASAAAPVPSADPAVIAATKQMLAAMKVREMMTTMMATMERQMPAQMRTSISASINASTVLTPEQKAEQLKKIDDSMPKFAAQAHTLFADPTLVDDIIAEMVPLYAETYTLDELHQLAAFYASPLGQKMQSTMPTLLTRSMEISQRVMMPRIQKALAQSAAADAKQDK